MTVREGPLSARYRLITLGSVVLVFVAAFENLAVTTVMPVVSDELDGATLYAVAFAAPLAASVVGMVVAGILCDRGSPRTPLVVSIALFVAGLVLAGTAASMPVLVAARLVQGLGSGGTIVALYVIIARVYPPALQARMFGLFSAAWVIPALVGPFVAGVVGEAFGWRWVFLGVVALVLPAAFLVLPAVRSLRSGPASAAAAASAALVEPGGPWPVARVVWSVLLAVAILALSVAAEFSLVVTVVVAAVSLTLAVLVLRPLVPRGVLTARRGLPSIVTTRLLLAAGFFAVETYLPYLLTSEHGLSPAFAGLTLTASGIAWGAASILQSRAGGRLAEGSGVPLGAWITAGAITVVVISTLLDLPAVVVIAGWAVSGAGMGLAYPRLSALLLARSAPAEQGFNSAALTIADGAGPAASLAIAGILFQSVPAPDPGSFLAVFLVGLALVLAAALVAPRLRSGYSAEFADTM
ncbi:MFS transporter [Herbiconiux sp. KACC 21604]|uniref:MFS transporter n=1 Tax=unclassified Herbiconiux TaxID=2618217 RepID=UPI0020A2F2A8|nr:MFS transporter [Herbiconiux sp. SALV-R1]WPO84965.1 MFS transporter [Herbiconiux sp. KACC 21604]